LGDFVKANWPIGYWTGFGALKLAHPPTIQNPYGLNTYNVDYAEENDFQAFFHYLISLKI
jgi:hypothetical protein